MCREKVTLWKKSVLRPFGAIQLRWDIPDINPQSLQDGARLVHRPAMMRNRSPTAITAIQDMLV